MEVTRFSPLANLTISKFNNTKEEEEEYSCLHCNYVNHGKIGEGTFGSVFMAESKHTGKLVAIKILKEEVSSFSSLEDCMKAIPEVKILTILKNHPNVIKLENVFQEDGFLLMVFEYMDTNLLHVIQDRQTRGIPFSEPEIRHVCLQLLKGLEYMHTHGFMHRDLKPENVLVTGNDVKVADLGSAAELSPNTEYTDYVTTRWYRAPEVLLQCVRYGSAVDLWAVGAIMAEMYMLKPLFPGKNRDDQLTKIFEFIDAPLPHVYLSKLMPTASYSAIDLMLILLSCDPNDRPSGTRALKHPFFYGPCLQQQPSSCSTFSSCAQLTAPLPRLPGLLV